jgi:hypothetical protein
VFCGWLYLSRTKLGYRLAFSIATCFVDRDIRAGVFFCGSLTAFARTILALKS